MQRHCGGGGGGGGQAFLVVTILWQIGNGVAILNRRRVDQNYTGI